MTVEDFLARHVDTDSRHCICKTTVFISTLGLFLFVVGPSLLVCCIPSM